MGARSTAREAALQMLFALESGAEPVEFVIKSFWRESPGDPEARSYADDLVRQVDAAQSNLDRLIGVASQNWRLERMALVDRNILRLATRELIVAREVQIDQSLKNDEADAPRAVVIDEAVELAKRYGSEESGKFVNGILERIANDLEAVADLPLNDKVNS